LQQLVKLRAVKRVWRPLPQPDVLSGGEQASGERPAFVAESKWAFALLVLNQDHRRSGRTGSGDPAVAV
jgi:hypothetical protein